MASKKYVAHINCSPWVEDGEWNIVIEKDYIQFTGTASDEKVYELIEDILAKALDTNLIHSYYIERQHDTKPTVHLPE